MKHLLFLLLISLLFSNCRTTKTATSANSVSIASSEVAKSEFSQVISSIDTTKSSDTEIVFRKVEYYNNPWDQHKEPTSTSSVDGAPLPEREAVEGSSGAIKSVETWTLKKKSEVAGKTETVTTVAADTTSSSSLRQAQGTSSEETPVPDPKRWRYIFLILVIGVGIFIYLKRSPIGGAVGSVLSKIGGFFKI